MFDVLIGFGSRAAYELKFKYASRGLRRRHFATNEHSVYTPQFEEVLDHFKLGLDDGVNLLRTRHSGRHPHKHGEWVLRTMGRSAGQAGGDVNKLLAIFDFEVIGGVLKSPDLPGKCRW